MWRVRIFSLLTVPAFIILYLFTAAVVIVLIPMLFLGMNRLSRGLMKGWAKSVFIIMGRKLHIEGIHNIEHDRRYILVANHTSLFDIVAIISFFPGLSWFGHERLTRIPVFRKVLVLINYVPMKKTTVGNTRVMMDELVEKSRNQTIGIFPEGTRSLNGKVSDFYRGFVILLRNSDTDVLPVTLKGFYELKPKNRFYLGFDSKLKVTIHKPIRRDDLISLDNSEIIKTVKERIESALLKEYNQTELPGNQI